MIKLITASFFLACLGVAFGYFVMIPQSLTFFGSYANMQIKPLISAMEYLNFVLNTLITFAVIFQIPLFVLFFNNIKPTKPRTLLKYQKHVVVGAFIIAVILPFTYDPVSQFVLAIPIVILYYMSVVLLWFANRKHAPQPDFAPVAKPQPILALTPVQAQLSQLAPQQTATTITNMPRPMRRSIDGFVSPRGHAVYKSRPVQPTPQPATKPTTSIRYSSPRLSIDGISRLAAA